MWLFTSTTRRIILGHLDPINLEGHSSTQRFQMVSCQLQLQTCSKKKFLTIFSSLIMQVDESPSSIGVRGDDNVFLFTSPHYWQNPTSEVAKNILAWLYFVTRFVVYG